MKTSLIDPLSEKNNKCETGECLVIHNAREIKFFKFPNAPIIDDDNWITNIIVEDSKESGK